MYKKRLICFKKILLTQLVENSFRIKSFKLKYKTIRAKVLLIILYISTKQSIQTQVL